ncbi:hypothetical protein MKEN_01167400 [Mycena kentingensis (nom. inval.)]|nr:hypothetical protein MKEN_01167400 [Mycena kentingensis (nom. inval.)]
MMSSEDPRLTEDLERLVCELCCSMYPDMLFPLSLVARRVQSWLEPLRYRTVNADDYPRLLRVSRNKPAAFLGTAVRRVLLPVYCEGFGELLRQCTGLRHLAVTTEARYVVDLRDIFPLLRLQRLALNITEFFPATAHPSLVPLATEATAFLPFLLLLPALTHLAYHHIVDGDAVRDLLGCPALEYLIRLTEYSSDALEICQILQPTNDIRLVVCTYEDWFDGVLDGRTYWDVAEEFVAGKRAGRIALDRFFARSEGDQ